MHYYDYDIVAILSRYANTIKRESWYKLLRQLRLSTRRLRQEWHSHSRLGRLVRRRVVEMELLGSDSTHDDVEDAELASG